jgi:hypothetical protein
MGMNAIYMLGVVIGLLQMILIGLGTWILKTTVESREKLSRLDVVFFGEKGNSGFQAEFAKFKTDEEYLRRTMQRVVFRLGAIEDHLKIPRNFNVGDTEDTELKAD